MIRYDITAMADHFFAFGPRKGADFEYVAEASEFEITGDVTIDASGCGQYASDYTATITNPTFSGTISLEGEIDGDTVTITGASGKTFDRDKRQ